MEGIITVSKRHSELSFHVSEVYQKLILDSLIQSMRQYELTSKQEITTFNFQSCWVLMRFKKKIHFQYSKTFEKMKAISRYYRKSVMKTITIQQYSLALIKLC